MRLSFSLRHTIAITSVVVLAGCSNDVAPTPTGELTLGNPQQPPTPDSFGLFFRESSYVMLKTGPAPTAGEHRFHFGVESAVTWKSNGMFPISGDFNGNGSDSVGVYCRRMSRFMLGFKNIQKKPNKNFVFVPDLPGTEPEGGWAQATSIQLWPVVGDWDGDGVDTVGLYHPASEDFHLKFANSAGTAADLVVNFGAGVIGRPVAGDWDGDGIDTLGVYDQVNHRFHLSNRPVTGSGSMGIYTVDLGGPEANVYPVVGDFDDDGTDTVAIYEEATGTFTYTNDVGASVTSTLSFGNDRFQTFERQSTRRGVPQLYPLAGNWSPIPAVTESAHVFAPLTTAQWATFNTALLDQAFDEAESAAYPHLHSLVVVRYGNLAREGYFRGYESDMANNVKSVSKSVLAALVGIAIAENNSLTGVGRRLIDYFGTELTDPNHPDKDLITIHDLLTMQTGLKWNEGDDYGNMKQSLDWAPFVLGANLVETPPASFEYSTGNTQVGAELIERVSGERLHEFATSRLWDPLGITCPRLDYEPNQGSIGMGKVGAGGHEMYLRPRDMAVFGELFLRGGTFNNVPVLDSAWVDDCVHQWNSGYGGYGYWWRVEEMNGIPVFHALGHAGQHILVAPSKELVVVMTSHWSVPATVDNGTSTVHNAGNPRFTANLNLFKNRILPSAL